MKPKTPASDFAVSLLDANHWLVRYNGKDYKVSKTFAPDVPEPYWDPKSAKWCYTRRRDFGGCGKDAIKPERNTPFILWLHRVGAVEVNCGIA